MGKADHEATAVYGILLYRHMKAERKDFHGEERARIYNLIEAFRAEFPAECEVWDRRYARRQSSEDRG